MGGVDKGWLSYQGVPLVVRALKLLSKQAGTVLISANRNLSRYRDLGVTVVADAVPGYQGPLAGVQALWRACGEQYLLLVPVDAIHLPDPISQILLDAKQGAVTVACCDGDDHFSCALLDRKLIQQSPPSHGSLRGWYQGLGGWFSVAMPKHTVLSANTHTELTQPQ